MKRLLNYLSIIILLCFLILLSVLSLIGWVFWSYGQNLPDYQQLSSYEPPVVTRVYASNGALLSEFAKEKRTFVPISSIPPLVINAFLSAEDKEFYNHFGLDLKAIFRATVTNINNLGKSRRAIGASTITQQVAKNFLLSSDYSLDRKIKEAILSIRIERAFSKDHILELYLNEIYLGFGSYGVAAASLNYFNKSLNELTLSEAAYLAALPKAPANYHPIRKKNSAISRRNWVLNQMLENGYINSDELLTTSKSDLLIIPRTGFDGADAPYAVEEIRKILMNKFGEKQLYKGGLAVRTSINPSLQSLSDRVLREGLESLDRRQGWRGVLYKKKDEETIFQAFKRASELIPTNKKIAIVQSVQKNLAEISLMDGSKGNIPLQNAIWAREQLSNNKLGKTPKSMKTLLEVGDIVPILEPFEENQINGEGIWMLSQKPEVSGALIVMDPHTGRILSMSGGYDFKDSEFNRATQAWRQTGSAFKPFIYLKALEKGYSPTTLIRDAPLVVDQGPNLPKWKPSNYSNKFYGPSTMRLGVEKSRNLMTARLALEIGMDSVREIALRFGLREDLPLFLSMSLGAGESTLLRLVTGYAMIANGGYKIHPTLIDRIQDRRGTSIFKHDDRKCKLCQNYESWSGETPPNLEDNRISVTDKSSAFQMTSILKGVVDRGTGIKLKKLNLNLAGKTGTTNDNTNAWFIGFAPDIVVGVYVGYDIPRPLGKRETGSSAAVPIFSKFVKEYFSNNPDIPFRRPSGIRLIPINPITGERSEEIGQTFIEEAFKDGQFPGSSLIIDGNSIPFKSNKNTIGGLY